MSCFKSEFLRIMEERGFIHQISDTASLDDLFLKEKVSAYIGFDPTAPSLHSGSLIQIMMLYWLQQTGHRPVILMGGGTAMVGDPSFKDENAEEIEVLWRGMLRVVAYIHEKGILYNFSRSRIHCGDAVMFLGFVQVLSMLI